MLRCVADSEYVVLHVYVKLDSKRPAQTVAEFYRMEAGKISEHWDVIQEHPSHIGATLFREEVVTSSPKREESE